MYANALSHCLFHISVLPSSKKSTFSSSSSLPLVSPTSRRAPLPSFSLENFVARFPSPLNCRIRYFITAAASSSSEEGEAALEEAAENSENPADGTEGAVAVAEEKPPRKPRIKLGDIIGILNKRAIEASEKQRPVPDLRTGDIVEIKLEVPENKRRLSVYKGIIISKQNAGIHTTIRIRRIIAGIGVEIVFPIYSPNIKEIKVVKHRKVRRARLYYLRDKLPRFSTFK
ncbi:50S ribosomal protein L19-2, chloroplastic-like [Phalaenopsis equestris]|uniref:50S ribosomal protein L19-2, chloroplastic-like n=1 Tax=Phalaenopsis equestris TaxID=78828 RepID=UPI0009E35B3C|nr:50S ribosomal protein L19-2, chloroplastic-like [Phalaenopsis equestris]